MSATPSAREIHDARHPKVPHRWGVTLVITTWRDGYRFTRHVPYFELNPRVQGTLTEESATNVALAIAADILGTSRSELSREGAATRATAIVVPIEEV